MLFSLKISVLGLAALTAAAPYQAASELEARQPAKFADRGLSWTPRSLSTRQDNSNNNNNNNRGGNGGNNRFNNIITITEIDTIQLTDNQRNEEIQLTQIIQERIDGSNQRQRDQDNVRQNHYRNNNKDQNTIIVIVSQVIDLRSGTGIQRYLTRQIRADNGNGLPEVAVVVNEVPQLSITAQEAGQVPQQGQAPTATSDQNSALASAIAAQASAIAVSNIQTYDPTAAFQQNNQTQLLPAGVPAPTWNLSVENDPAMIIEANQPASVSFD